MRSSSVLAVFFSIAVACVSAAPVPALIKDEAALAKRIAEPQDGPVVDTYIPGGWKRDAEEAARDIDPIVDVYDPTSWKRDADEAERDVERTYVGGDWKRGADEVERDDVESVERIYEPKGWKRDAEEVERELHPVANNYKPSGWKKEAEPEPVYRATGWKRTGKF